MAQYDVMVGDRIQIDNETIDMHVAQYLSAGKNRKANTWELYRDVVFDVHTVKNHGVIVVYDSQHTSIELKPNQYTVL